ncbi:type III-A CRISPR-associated RAMP protein Csm5 [Persephonella sp.]
MGIVKNKIGERTEIFKLKILSPIHIGTGNRLTKLDFIIKDGYVFVLNVNRAIDYLLQDSSDILDEEILDSMARNTFSWNSYFPERKRVPDEIIKYKAELNTEIVFERIKNIWETIKEDNKNLYIPASEVKGFIRTAIIYNYVKDNWDKFKNRFHNLNKRFNFKKFIEDEIFGSASQDPMKFLKIDDIYGEFQLEINGAKLVFSPRKGHLVDCIEVIRGGSLSYNFRIKVWEERLKFVGDIAGYILNWKEACYKFVKDYLEVEIKFWDDVANGSLAKYIGNKHVQIVNMLNKSSKLALKVKADLEMLKNENTRETPLFRIGKYTGYLNHTIGLLLKNLEQYSKPQPYNLAPLGNHIGAKNAKPFLFPLTRRLTLDNQTLGWCKLVESYDSENEDSEESTQGKQEQKQDLNSKDIREVFKSKGWKLR